MPRGVIDYAALASAEALAMRAKGPDGPLPFDIRKVGHVVLYVTDLERAVDFYTRILGFRVSDVYPDTMMDGGMVFMRCNADHHGVALVGDGERPDAGPGRTGMHHMACRTEMLGVGVRLERALSGGFGLRRDLAWGRRPAARSIAGHPRTAAKRAVQMPTEIFFWVMRGQPHPSGDRRANRRESHIGNHFQGPEANLFSRACEPWNQSPPTAALPASAGRSRPGAPARG